MPSLASNLRKDLENAVKQARRAAESGAGKALDLLAVANHESWGSLTPAQVRLRKRLRAHSVQLGDVRDDKRGTQSVTRLKGEVAYEHWHRMLFARYLAENDLLIEPESGQAMTMDECRELAREQGKDWIPVACAYAQQMLPEIFRQDDPVLEVALPPETRSELEDVLNDLPRDVFLASDSLGWVYQFWQSDQKETVNKSGNKIGADELPAVTQLFTEDYMVDFLLDNTLGAWHAGKVLAANPKLAESAQSEDELRQACALPGCPWKYLRFVKVARASRSCSDTPDRDGLATVRGLDPSTFVITSGENLPHWTCDDAIYHVSFRLADSVPQSKREEWIRERESLAEPAKRENRELTAEEEDRIRYLYSERIEKFLDSGHGACLLKDLGIAELVSGAIRHFAGQRYTLHAWTVMPNHVHVIVEPLPGHELAAIIHSWKSFTAHEINKRLGRSGDVWQHDAYNHIIRTEKEYRFQIAYVWENPDKAGLTDWKWRWIARASGDPDREVARASRSGSDLSGSNKDPDRDGLATWTPAAGTFEGWPKSAQELKCLDPCMGSGHFVVAMFERLVALRMAEEKLGEKAAVAAVIRDNLFGLELDPRCTQIGAFNLALAAWRRVGHCALPAMNLACSGLAPNTPEADWLAIAGDDEKLQRGMERLYRLFQKAAVLGSLINPRAGEGDLLVAAFHELQPLLEKALAQEAKDDTAHEMAVTARGLAKAAEILAGKFTLVATNVPYLGRGKQDEVLGDYCENIYPEAKADLATCFVERCLTFCGKGGSTALVTPQNWLFLGTYRKLRERLLEESQWNSAARLGEGGFDSPQAAGAFAAMVCITRTHPDLVNHFLALDVAKENSPAQKAAALVELPVLSLGQKTQTGNPDARVVFGEAIRGRLLSDYASAYWGQGTGDFTRFGRNFWELAHVSSDYDFMQSTVTSPTEWGGREYLIFWQQGKGELVQLAEELRERLKNIHRRGAEAWGKPGVCVSLMRELLVTRYGGQIFDGNCAAVVPKDPAHVPAIWAFCSSPDFNKLVRSIDQKLNVTNHTLLKIPFDLAHWQKVAAEKYPHGLPKPFSSDPTQWLFNGHPAGADQPLQVAVARLLGYQWPRQTGSNFPDCPALTADGLEKLADKDGIVCLSATKGEAPAADRLNALLAAAFGSEWSSTKARELLSATGLKAKSLADWLSDDFFAQHCDLFHQRPFIWHVWDGLKGGFSALVNYHRLAAGDGAGKRTLDKLIYTYLGEWIDAQRKAQKAGVEGADARLTAAEHLSAQLKAILAGEPPFDLFVRWKPLHEQPIGWSPDLNDGVRLNIRPFISAKPLNARGKNACILRATPKVSWDKDRGKEPQRAKSDFPWFWTWDEATADFKGGSTFDGNRWNDCHYSNATKQAARERQQSKKS